MAPSGHSVAQSTVQRPLSNPTSVHNALVRLHRWLGLATMFFLIAAGLSGSALVFRAELDAALNPDLFSSRSLSPVQSPAAIADAVSRAHPEFVITETPLTAERGRTLAMSVAPARTPLGYDQIFVDPHDGRIVGTRSVAPGWDRRHFVEGLYQFHYTLLGGTIGRWVMGVVAALWTVGNLIGFYLTLPRDRPFWQRWARMWMVARKTRPPSRG